MKATISKRGHRRKGSENNAVVPFFDHEVDISGFLRALPVGATENCAVTRLVLTVFDTAGYLGKEGIRDIGNHQPDGMASLVHQSPGQSVETILRLPGGPENQEHC